MASHSISRKSLPSENIRLEENPLGGQHDNRPFHADTKYLLSTQYGDADTAIEINERRSTPRHLFRSDWWLWEIVFTGISVASVIAMIGILQAYNGQPLPNWPHFINLNAFLAIMSTIFKASMMVSVAACIGQLKWLWFRQPRHLRDFDTVDQASRGSWGSILLLSRLTSTQLVSIGAVITILATAIDPFTQQIVSYPLRQDSTAERALVARAQSYNEGSHVLDVGGGVKDAPSIGTKAAVYQGIFTSDVQPLIPDCPTGNCTFPAFDSLALCSKCVNVTDDVRNSQTQGRGAIGNVGNWLLNMTYHLPGGIDVDIQAAYSDKSMKSLGYGPAFVSLTKNGSEITEGLGIKNPLLSLAVLQFKAVDAAGYDGDYLTSPPVVHECVLYFCVQTYNVTVKNSKAHYEVISSWYNETDPVLPEQHGNPDRTLHRPNDQPSLDNSGRDFTIHNRTYGTALWYLNKTLSGTVVTRVSEVNSDNNQVDDVLAAMQHSDNVGDMMNNFVTSFTNRMRAMANDTDNKVQGTALISVPYVRVQWAWLSLPILLMVLSLVFLVATSIITKKSNIPVWKTSTLAVIFHGLSETSGQSPQRPHMNMEFTSQMKREGERRRVALTPNGNGEWKLQDCI